MYIRPIPLNTLIHTVGYQEVVTPSRYGNEYKEQIDISNTLVQFGSGIKRRSLKDNESDQKYAKAILFLDAMHTTPFILLKEQSKIIFDEQVFIIDFIDHCYAFDKTVHHYEVTLI